MNEDIVKLDEQQRNLAETQRATGRELAVLRKPIQEEFDALQRAHDLKVAALKLGG